MADTANATDWAQARGLADALLAARREGRSLAAADLPVPPSPAAAADVQKLVSAGLGDPVLGWKVGIGPHGGAVAAPMRPVLDDGGMAIERPWHPRTGIEVELCFRLRDGAAPGTDIGPEALLAHVEAAHLGVEITGGRLAEGNRSPYPLFLADSLDNDGYVIGPAVPLDIVADVVAGQVPLVVSGAVSWSGPARHPQGHPLAPLAGVLADGLWRLGGGAIVTTGSFCGLVPVPAPGVVEVAFGTGFAMALRFA